MHSTKTTLMAAVMAFSITANAHMKLATPTPYGSSSLNNSPLDAGGADFPCKLRPGAFDVGDAKNIMPIGVNQTLSFIGGATHGGGSCQISLTKDKQPTKDSKWMVIHSIIGGCPSGATGNVGEDAAGTGAAKFEYSIPEGIAPGDYSLAWTWFNKVGNREMYMNCAPVTVTGGSKKREEIETTKRDTSFPDMFVANIKENDCKTVDSADVQFPNPGPSVQMQSAHAVPPTGSQCGGASGGSSSSGSSSSGSSSSGGVFAAGASSAPSSPPAASSVPAVSPPVASAAPSAAPAPAVAPGNTSSSSSSGSSGSTGSAPAAAPAPATGGSGAAPAAGAAGSSSCSAPGTEVCSPDGTQIGMCDSTSHVVFQPVAGGTKCVGGQMVMAGSKKRSAKFAGRDRVRRGGSAAPWGFSYNN